MRTRTAERIEGRAGVAPAPDPLVESFERRVAEFTAAARRVRGGSDAEAIHDLRVAARRLAAALRVWKELTPARAGRAARSGLRRIRRRLGGARELEVHIALLEERLPADAAPAGSLAARVLERLRERLVRRRRSAARRVSPRRLKRVLRRLETAGAGLGTPPPGGAGALAPGLEVERRRADETAAALRAASEHPDDVALHEARVQVKKWRYTLECLEEVAPRAARQSVRPLRRIQGELGDVHDRALLCELLERHARRAGATDDGIRRLIGGLEGERERAVRRFQRLATTFLGRGREASEKDRAQDRPQPPLALEAPASGPAPLPDSATAEAAPDADRGVAGGPDAPRDERWDRMATWLHRSGRRR
jgi:CHAD domain-containing protein